MNFPRILKTALETPGGMVIAPGAYDGLSARLIAEAGFDAVYMTGAGVSASRVGQPDVGLATMTEMVAHAAMIVECTQLPVIADADTGYGNALNMIRTVREYERAGVAGIHIEDQVFPKRCGHLGGKQLIPTAEYIQKIRAAVDARRNPDFVIIARIDARATLGLEETIVRANRSLAAGAGVAFVEAPQTLQEMRDIPKLVKGPCLLNMVGPGSKTPAVTTKEIKDMGYKIVIYPAVAMFTAFLTIRDALKTLKESGVGWSEPRWASPTEFFSALGLKEWSEFEQKYVAPKEA